MKNVMLASIFGFALCTGTESLLIASASTAPLDCTTSNEEDKNDSFIGTIKEHHLIRLGLITGGFTLLSSDTNNVFLRQLAPKTFLKIILSEYLRTFCINLCHESAHALTARILTDSTPTVYLGSGTTAKGITLFPGLIINGWAPTKGVTEPIAMFSAAQQKDTIEKIKAVMSTQDITQQEKIKLLQDMLQKTSPQISQAALASIILSGPLCGMLTNFAIKFLANENPLIPDTRDIWQLCNLLIREKSDGTHLAKSVFGLSPQKIEKLKALSLTLTLFMLLGLSVIHAQFSSQGLTLQSFADACGYNCINFAVNGFAHFNNGVGV